MQKLFRSVILYAPLRRHIISFMPGIAFSDWVDPDKAITMGHLELIKEKELYDPILRFEYRHLCLAVSSNQPAVAKWLSIDFEFNYDHVQTAIVNDYLELTQLLEYWADERFIEIAVRCKSYKVGNWLIAKYHPKRPILIRAAICGFAEAIRQLGDDEEALSEVLDETAQYNIVKYIGRKKPHLLHSRNLEYALLEGNFSTVRYLYNFGIRTDNTTIHDIGVYSKNVRLVRWATRRDFVFSNLVIQSFSRFCSVEDMKIMINNPKRIHIESKAVTDAILVGKVGVAKLLLDHNLLVVPESLEELALRRHFKMLVFLRQYITQDIMKAAMVGGSLRVVKFLHELGQPYAYTYQMHFTRDHIPLIKFLMQNNIPFRSSLINSLHDVELVKCQRQAITYEIIERAARSGYFESFKYLVENADLAVRCLISDELVMQAKLDYRILKYIHENIVPIRVRLPEIIEKLLYDILDLILEDYPMSDADVRHAIRCGNLYAVKKAKIPLDNTHMMLSLHCRQPAITRFLNRTIPFTREHRDYVYHDPVMHRYIGWCLEK